MNNLKTIMELRNITPMELSEKTGLAPSSVRRLMQENNIATAHPHTKQIIANVLGLTVRDLTEGGENMKTKILEAEVTNIIQTLIAALRKYSDEGLYISFFAFTHDKESVEPDNPNDIPDYYSMRVHFAQEDANGDYEMLLCESGRIFYKVVDGEEGIRKIVPYHKERK